ncbi:TIM barrel protein [Singulisphaera rosea]
MIDRRTFLKSTGSLAAAATLTSGVVPAAPAPSAPRWKKAFMLATRDGPVQRDFKDLKAAGFEGVELLSPNNLNGQEVLRARDATGLIIHGVSGSRHWQDTLSHPNPEVVERGLSAIRKEIEDCKYYGGTTVLVVPAVVTSEVSYRDAYKRSQANIRKLLPFAEEHGIKLAIEEVWNKFLLSPIEFARYIDEFESPWIGAYFDVGNVVEYGFPQEWIRELGKRILKIHVKEYKKEKRFNYKLGEGEINWAEVRKALIEVGYEGWITAEVSPGTVEELTEVTRRMNTLLFKGA